MVDVQDGDLPGRLPSPFLLSGESDFAAWITAHQDELERYAGDLEAVAKSLKITQADGRALDELGKGFGQLGRRRGRDDGPYRSYLLSLVGAFNGRGTPPGLRLAIAAGVLADQDDVALIEDFQSLEYEVVLRDWQAHRTGTVHALADLADPSVVARRDPIHYDLPTAAVQYSAEAAVARGGTGLPDAVTHYAVDDTEPTTVDSSGTFGTNAFDGDSSFS
ncbi:hypothetical protein J2752_000470 [Halarchaeum rubridurum]|uniref:Uncharacterized protein n=1 Tax=Halarchaeum rubridurum TaxID=489911 RepID=A0A830FM97_9EURY|nr:hypothetical protein [Halarchaeum rubridurum]MBP1953589.1 hypothetical protein [Halarchaeum rubridurum]GGM64140.1 hypothetical protein GCM10009017_12740 [Halarchaeum rubridurum]